VKKKKQKKLPELEPITLHPAKFEDVVKALLQTKPPPKKAKK